MYKKFRELENKRGISLIVLVITIIVIIILAGAVILSLSNNNPIASAGEAVFKNDVKSFETELELYKSQQYLNKQGAYNPDILQADYASATYNGANISGTSTIKDIITSLNNNSKYDNKFKIKDGKLVYLYNNDNDTAVKDGWIQDVGITAEKQGEATVNVTYVTTSTVLSSAKNPTTQAEFKISISSLTKITTNLITSNVVLIDNSGNEVSPQPTINITSNSDGNDTDLVKTIDVKVTIQGLTDGTYSLKVKAGAISNSVGTTQDISSLTGFSIDNTAPTTPNIVASPTTPTNGSVVLTVTDSDTNVTLKYSLDAGSTWQDYTTPITVTNNTEIYAKAIDSAGNESTVTTFTVNNIDKTAPTVTYVTNGGDNLSSASTVVNSTDTGSGINTLQYVWDTQNTTTPSTGWTAFTTGATLSKAENGTWYLWIQAQDNAGNITTSKSNVFNVVSAPETETIVSTKDTVNKTFAGATTGFTYNNPIIPAGFVAVDTPLAKWEQLSSNSSWNNGLVIQDDSGNQFVWIPVDGTNVTYAKNFTYPSNYGATSSNTTDDTFPESLNETTLESKYQGFYIGRYEAGFDYNGGSLRATEKKSTNKTTSSWTRDSSHTGYLWNFINYTDSKSYAESMDTSYSYDTTKIGTNLVTGTQWDTTMKWIQNTSINVASDSRAWGNYSNSIAPANVSGYGSLQVSGYSTNWRAKNIFDLAGNVWEWTNEKYSTYYVDRGGNYGLNGTYYPAASRFGANATGSFIDIGARVSLYIK